MKRLLASVAISALVLSGAAFAADAPSAVQKDQAPMATTTNKAATPAKPGVADSQAKKPVATKKDKTSLNAPAAPRAQLAQAPATATPAKPAVDDSHAKKPAVVKKSDGKSGTESAQPSTSTTTKPATR
ncbi:MAG: hypothetical protein HY060_03170 [Proteobacteria bacterium]|nr:hypothetical protein [Pseudomonadota bacterium]